jgi:hypothetical protein
MPGIVVRDVTARLPRGAKIDASRCDGFHTPARAGPLRSCVVWWKVTDMSAIYLRPFWHILVQYAVALRGLWKLDAAERPVHPHHHVVIGM